MTILSIGDSWGTNHGGIEELEVNGFHDAAVDIFFEPVVWAKAFEIHTIQVVYRIPVSEFRKNREVKQKNTY